MYGWLFYCPHNSWCRNGEVAERAVHFRATLWRKKRRCTMRTYVGVDYHRKYSYLTGMDERGQVLRQGTVENQRQAVTRFLASDDGAGYGVAVLEATRNWAVMHDWLDGLVDEVHLAHPQKVKAIAEAKIKTDKIDARGRLSRILCLKAYGLLVLESGLKDGVELIEGVLDGGGDAAPAPGFELRDG